jgi:hypothetical protein
MICRSSGDKRRCTRRRENDKNDGDRFPHDVFLARPTQVRAQKYVDDARDAVLSSVWPRMIRTDKSSHKPDRRDAAAVQLQTGREKTCWSSLLVQNARLPVAGPIDGTQV